MRRTDIGSKCVNKTSVHIKLLQRSDLLTVKVLKNKMQRRDVGSKIVKTSTK